MIDAKKILSVAPIPQLHLNSQHDVALPVCNLSNTTLEFINKSTTMTHRHNTSNNVHLCAGLTADGNRLCRCILFPRSATGGLISYDKEYEFPIARRLEFGYTFYNCVQQMFITASKYTKHLPHLFSI